MKGTMSDEKLTNHSEDYLKGWKDAVEAAKKHLKKRSSDKIDSLNPYVHAYSDEKAMGASDALDDEADQLDYYVDPEYIAREERSTAEWEALKAKKAAQGK